MATGLDKMRNKMRETYGKKLAELRGGKKQFWEAPEGDHEIRILPSWLGENGLFYKEIAQHYGLGPDKNLSAVCPGDDCPICKRCAKWALASPGKQKKAERISAKTRMMLNIVHMDAPRVVKIWSVSPALLQELLALTLDPDYGEFWDFKRGYNLRVTRTGQKLKTRWKIRPAKNASKLKGWKKIRKNIIDLDAKFKPLERYKLKALMNGENVYERREDDEAA